MKVIYEYTHFGGSEILHLRHPECENDIYAAIKTVNVLRNGKHESDSIPKRHDLKAANRQFKAAFKRKGFEELRDSYSVSLPNTEISIPGATKQLDYFKSGVAVQVRFGSDADAFYDIAKFHYFYMDNKIDVGVEILPCQQLLSQASGHIIYGERLIHDLSQYWRHFPTVPVKVILIGEDIPSDRVI